MAMLPPRFNRTELKKQLIEWIDRRYAARSGNDLADYFFSNHLFYHIDSRLVDFMVTFRTDIAAYLASEAEQAALVDYMVQATKQYTYQRNQFINFSRFYDDLLYAEYRRFVAELTRVLAAADGLGTLNKTFAGLLKAHHERLRLVFSAYCIASDRPNLKENRLLRTVPCGEYSARFQLRLLALDLDRLAGPILDLGCGTAGNLVYFLRSQGYTAFGLDRLAPADPYFYREDWFEFNFGSQPWGTIIAHQSFSTHFIYNHLNHPARAEVYARCYMRLLAALQPGGRFCYAPGLPFFEEQLEKTGRYVLRKTAMPAENPLAGIRELFYATQVMVEM